MTVMRTWTTFPDCVKYLCYDSAYTGQSTPITAFDGFTLYFAFTLQAHRKFA